MELKKSPLVEAVFQLAFAHDFGEYDPTLPGLFYSTIKERFKHKKEIPNFKYEIIDNDGTEKSVTATLSRFSDDDGNHIQITKDYIVFNKIRPSIHWEILKENILSNVGNFIDVNNGNNDVGFCSLRYVNVIEVAIGKNNKDYFNISLPIPKGEDFSKIKLFNNLIEFDYKGTHAKLEFRTVSPTDTHHRTLLEIAIMKTDGFEYSNDIIEKWLIEAHQYICEIFSESVNVKLLDQESHA